MSLLSELKKNPFNIYGKIYTDLNYGEIFECYKYLLQEEEICSRVLLKKVEDILTKTSDPKIKDLYEDLCTIDKHNKEKVLIYNNLAKNDLLEVNTEDFKNMANISNKQTCKETVTAICNTDKDLCVDYNEKLAKILSYNLVKAVEYKDYSRMHFSLIGIKKAVKYDPKLAKYISSEKLLEIYKDPNYEKDNIIESIVEQNTDDFKIIKGHILSELVAESID